MPRIKKLHDEPQFYTFRYFFTERENDPMNVIYRMFGSDENPIPPGILGIETLNKVGEIIRKHMHFHFTSREYLDSIRKRFLRSRCMDDDGKLIADDYMLAMNNDTYNPDRCFRYPLKQYIPSEFVYKWASRIPVPEGFDIKEQQLCAYEEWDRNKDHHIKKRDKALSRDTIYEKIIKQISENSVIFLDLKQVRYYVLQYFLDNDIPPDRLKCANMADGIALCAKIIDFDEFYRY